MSVWWRFWLVFGLPAIGYVSLPGWSSPAVGALLKPLPVLLAAGWVLRQVPNQTGRWVGSGLLWSSAGDIALALGDRCFLAGLAAFFVAHLCYMAGLLPSVRISRSGFFRVAGVVIYGVGVGLVIGRATQWSPPVFAYTLVLTTMGITAALRDADRQVYGGALLFIVSDSLLAMNRFLSPFPEAHQWVMLTYYAAQGLIASGIVAENIQRRSAHTTSV